MSKWHDVCLENRSCYSVAYRREKGAGSCCTLPFLCLVVVFPPVRHLAIGLVRLHLHASVPAKMARRRWLLLCHQAPLSACRRHWSTDIASHPTLGSQPEHCLSAGVHLRRRRQRRRRGGAQSAQSSCLGARARHGWSTLCTPPRDGVGHAYGLQL